MRMLVVGVCAYTGAMLTEMLIEKDHEVTAADRFLFGEKPANIENIIKIKGDYLLSSHRISFSNIIKKSGGCNNER